MRLLTGIFVVFCALACGAQTVTPTAAPAEDEEESEQTTNAAPVAAQTSAPNPAASQINAGSTDIAATVSGETNAPPAKDPAKCVVAHFGFDGNLQPDIGGGATIPVTFTRKSAAYLDGRAISESTPRFVEGRSGQAVLLESAYANQFSIAQAGAAELNAFKPVLGATLSISSAQPWQGNESLAVTTKGENSEEGFCVEAAVEKAFYSKETAPVVVPAYYLASLYLKGQGNVKITLKDTESGTCGEPVYVELPANWQRFQCLFGYKFNRINLGENHEADWKNLVSQKTNITAHLQLVCTTVDSQKLNFFADGFQLEQRHAVAARNTELSPHSWVLGAFQMTQEQLTIDVKNNYFNTWGKTGSIAFWFKPLWEARDSSGEVVLQIARNQLYFVHSNQKIVLSPAGVSFTPYDWKNNWHHVVIAWNEAGERTLYVDGMDYPNAKGETRPIKGPESITAGDFLKNLSPNGALDELTLYNITLNSEQAKALAAAEPAVKPAGLKSPDQLPAPVATITSTSGQTPASNPPPASAAQDDDAEDE